MQPRVNLYNAQGAALLIILIIIGVLSLIIMADTQKIIMNQKINSNIRHTGNLFHRAELGMTQAVFSHRGISLNLPSSPIQLATQENLIERDHCNNETIDIIVIAFEKSQVLTLKSRHIFATVPGGCGIPSHKTVWWKIE